MSTLAANRSQIQRLAIVVPVGIALAWLFGTLLATKDMETLRAGVILTVLVFLSLIIFWLAARSEPDGRLLFAVLFLSFAFKLVALYFRFYTGLFADAYVYNNVGQDMADQMAEGRWPMVPHLSGTFFVRILTGIVYLLIGHTFSGISILWAWFGLLGMLLFYKAFTTAFPDGNRRLYMLLVMLYPSMLLWTSALGKDALMMLLSGMAVYGLVRLRRRVDMVGVICLPLGLAGMLAVRPHMAAIFTLALAISMITQPIGAGRMTPFIKILGLIVMLGVALGVAVTASRLVGVERLELEEVEQFIGERQVGTGERGGSAFTPIDTGSPLGLALLIPTVLFRPFPFEVHNFNALLASLEGLGLLALVVYRIRSVGTAIVGALRNNYPLFIVVFALEFVYIFSAIANFGIIARQRVQVYPFIFMLIAYLSASPRSRQA